jgi:hypothetical protein
MEAQIRLRLTHDGQQTQNVSLLTKRRSRRNRGAFATIALLLILIGMDLVGWKMQIGDSFFALLALMAAFFIG